MDRASPDGSPQIRHWMSEGNFFLDREGGQTRVPPVKYATANQHKAVGMKIKANQNANG